MLALDTVVNIRVDHFRDKVPIKMIARKQRVSWNTVRRTIRQDPGAFGNAGKRQPMLGLRGAELERMRSERADPRSVWLPFQLLQSVFDEAGPLDRASGSAGSERSFQHRSVRALRAIRKAIRSHADADTSARGFDAKDREGGGEALLPRLFGINSRPNQREAGSGAEEVRGAGFGRFVSLFSDFDSLT